MKIMRADQSFPLGKGYFTVQRYRPGLIFEDEENDWAFGPISLIDHAALKKGALIKMHEHTNDEILSYMYKGKMLHKDSDDSKVFISPVKNMMMNAGESFWHEESAPNEDIEMLQIIIRPCEADMAPHVQFSERKIETDGKWHLIAAPEKMNPPMSIRQEVAIYDAHGKSGDRLDLPQHDGMTPWLFVMEGQIEIEGYPLDKGDAVSGDANELTHLKFTEDGVVVLFLADLAASMTYKGKFSGPKNDYDLR